MTPVAASLTCSDNLFGRLCTFVQERHFGGSDVFGVVLQDFLQGLAVFVIVIAVGRFLRRITVRGVMRTSADAQIRTLVNNVFMITTLTVAILAGLTAGGLNINVLLTFGGLTSLALGLAFQDLLRNILAGIFLLIERPFRIGDLITVGDQTGSVQTIQLRTTALRTPDGKLAILPNLTAFSGTVINSTAFDMRRFTVSVRLAPGADLAGAVARTRGVIEGNDGVAKEPKPFVQPRLDADGGVTLQWRYWVEYRTHEPDALAATLVSAIYDALEPWPSPPPSAPTPGVASSDAAPAGEPPSGKG